MKSSTKEDLWEVGFLSKIARDWLGFERLRQELIDQGCRDPASKTSSRDVGEVVALLLDPAQPKPEVTRVRVALLRSLAEHPAFIGRRFGDGRKSSGRGKSALQAMPHLGDDMAAVRPFAQGLQRVQAQVCKVQVDNVDKATGFLVSDRHVLTACHAIQELIDDLSNTAQPDSHRRLKLIFDHLPIDDDGGLYSHPVSPASDWLKLISRPDPDEITSKKPLDTLVPDRYDFALIELREAVGKMSPTYAKGVPRQWIDLDQLANDVDDKQMLMVHHPSGADLKISVGSFHSHSACRARVRYKTPTLKGSSGAPCFTVNWKPYALHNAGYTQKRHVMNQGVPLAHISAAIRAGTVPTTASRAEPPVVDTDSSPVLVRQGLMDAVEQMLDPASGVTTLVITGEKGAGKSYTAHLLRRHITGTGHFGVVLSAETFASDTPETFARRMAALVSGTPSQPTPNSPDARQRARWIARQLSAWTSQRVASVPGLALASAPANARRVPDQPEAAASRPGTVWIILDDLHKVRLTQETHDLLVALLADELDEGSTPVRFVLVGYDGDLASMPPKRVLRTEFNLLTAPAIAPYLLAVAESCRIPMSADDATQKAIGFVETFSVQGTLTVRAMVDFLQRWRVARIKQFAPESEAL